MLLNIESRLVQYTSDLLPQKCQEASEMLNDTKRTSWQKDIQTHAGEVAKQNAKASAKENANKMMIYLFIFSMYDIYENKIKKQMRTKPKP